MDSRDHEPQSRQENEDIVAEHAQLRVMFGLDKPLSQRGCPVGESAPRGPGARPFLVVAVAIAVVAASVAAWLWYGRCLDRQEEELAMAKIREQREAEEARRNRIEFGSIAFLDSVPPLVAISMDGRPLYARSKDGSYTELRARESSWIHNLPIKEDTILHFGFSAEGFKPLTRSVAYYDWLPSRTPGGADLQKAFTKVYLEPDVSPRIPDCAQLPELNGVSPCEWTVLREIGFRTRYAEALPALSAVLPADDKSRRARLAQIFKIHPALAVSARGFDPAQLDQPRPYPPADAPEATRNLLRQLEASPYGLYGSITVQTDTPQTRVFFMSEPLMEFKASGSMVQVQVQPDAPYTFSTYGQGRPIDIAEPMTVRLEAPGLPAYVAEISPLQWHCQIPALDVVREAIAPVFPADLASPDFLHYLCDYSLTVSVRFEEIRALEAERQKALQNASEKSQENEMPTK